MKKAAKKVLSDAKRDLAKTGNGKLRSSTVRELQNSDSLLALRKNMGPTATGFQSKHCSDADQLPASHRELNALNATSGPSKTGSVFIFKYTRFMYLHLVILMRTHFSGSIEVH